MPRKEVDDRLKTVYDLLDWLGYSDDFDVLMCVQEWVNDNFCVAEFRVTGSHDDHELEDVSLGWQ